MRMLLALSAPELVLLVVFLGAALTAAAQRGRRRLQRLIEVRDGRPHLSDEGRRRLERWGLNPDDVEKKIATEYGVDCQGRLVRLAPASAQPASQSPATTAPEQPAPEREDVFRSIWDEQKDEPSIWDDEPKQKPRQGTGEQPP